MQFDNVQYLSLGTFRKTGIRVDTPVWFAEEGSCIYVLSNNQAGKVKRLKNSSHCQIAPCTMMGKIIGKWEDASGFIIDNKVDINLAHNALKKKYGFQMLLLDSGAWIGGKIKQRSFIRVERNSH